MSEQPVASPCISVCALDEHDMCTGCFRTLAEITCWADCGNAEKRDIVVQARERMKRHFKLA